jgi:hypothetical protein
MEEFKKPRFSIERRGFLFWPEKEFYENAILLKSAKEIK